MDIREIRINFNSRGDPSYKSQDLFVNQYSKMVDMLSVKMEVPCERVMFAARRNDGEESVKVQMTYNEEKERYEYFIGEGELDGNSSSSWFTYIAGKLLITVYAIHDDQYFSMQTFAINVNPSVYGESESIVIPPTLVNEMLNQIKLKIDKQGGTANNIIINGGTATNLKLTNCTVDKPKSDLEIANKIYVDDKIKTYETQPSPYEVDSLNYCIVIKN